MRIIDAINQTDSLTPNVYSTEEKVRWLSQVEGLVLATVSSGQVFQGYDGDTDTDTEMKIPSPYDTIYLRWLEAQIHYHNGEMDRYNNAIVLYRDLLEGYQANLGRNGGAGNGTATRFRF